MQVQTEFPARSEVQDRQILFHTDSRLTREDMTRLMKEVEGIAYAFLVHDYTCRVIPAGLYSRLDVADNVAAWLRLLP